MNIASTKKLPALLWREVLEHKNIWRVPLILIAIGLLVRLSMTIGNLAVDIDFPGQLQFDGAIDSVLDRVVAKSLNTMNYIIILVMFVVAVFYALACLYDERQDDSVLFWRSLPISDSLTVTSKLLVAVLLVPLLIVICQAVLAMIFFVGDSFTYLLNYYSSSLVSLVKMILWSLLPSVSWCILCSAIANKNPFLLAFLAPLMLILVDKLFLNGVLSQTFIINRFWGVTSYTTGPLLTGLIFSAGCIWLAIFRRSQRV